MRIWLSNVLYSCSLTGMYELLAKHAVPVSPSARPRLGHIRVDTLLPCDKVVRSKALHIGNICA